MKKTRKSQFYYYKVNPTGLTALWSYNLTYDILLLYDIENDAWKNDRMILTVQ